MVKPRLRGEARLVRYIDDFVLCFQYREDALRVQDALCKRLRKFGLTLEPSKTKLAEFGRFAQRHAAKRGRKLNPAAHPSANCQIKSKLIQLCTTPLRP